MLKFTKNARSKWWILKQVNKDLNEMLDKLNALSDLWMHEHANHTKSNAWVSLYVITNDEWQEYVRLSMKYSNKKINKT